MLQSAWWPQIQNRSRRTVGYWLKRGGCLGRPDNWKSGNLKAELRKPGLSWKGNSVTKMAD
jgi:hypothetical protein